MIKLNEFLAREPEMVGGIEHYFKYNKQLPFLFKILSVAQPLSLQAHPDKKLAQVLHKSDPKNYPDANHKPELAVALTDFEILCDFRPHREIVHFLATLAPLRRIVGEKNFQLYQEALTSTTAAIRRSQESLESLSPSKKSAASPLQIQLAACFKNLMTSDKSTILEETKNLAREQHSKAVGKDLLNLVAELSRLYPGDPGVFAPFFLNHIKLAPGQAVYLQANKLHAYLKGECIECMACSDNVVRAGLTTKYRDVQTLISMLDYQPVDCAQQLILAAASEQQLDGKTTLSLYAPTEEFKVEKIVVCPLENSTKEYTLPAVQSGSFIIVLNGKAKTKDFFSVKTSHNLSFGYAGFVPPKISPKLSDIQGSLVLYRAYC